DDREVGKLARLDRAARIFFKRGVRRVFREAANRFCERQLLLRIPAARRPSFLILTRDGGVDSEKWIDRFDRKIGSEREADSVAQRGAPRVRAFDPLRTDAIFSPIHVGRGMR